MIAKLIHITLAAMVLFSTTGLTLSKHFCQNELQGIGVFTQAKGCHHSEHAPCQSKHCDSHPEKEEEGGCCKKIAKYYKLDQDQQVHVLELDLVKKPFVAIVVPRHLEQPVLKQGFPATYQSYKPPIVCPDFQSVLQTYRL